MGIADGHAMDWHRAPDADARDPHGVAGLLARAHADIGGPPLHGTRFLINSAAMLAATRRLEAAVGDHAAHLHVGFQRAAKLRGEAAAYRDLVAADTRITAFGMDPLDQAIDGLRWIQLQPDPTALENQWFLVTTAPRPSCFVGFEVSPATMHGRGPASDAAKRWEGFESSDPRLVEAISAHLDEVAARAV